MLDSDFVKKWYTKSGLDLTTFISVRIQDIDDLDLNRCNSHFSAWLYNKKSILMGRMIGDILDIDLIPQSYKNVITRAREVESNG